MIVPPSRTHSRLAGVALSVLATIGSTSAQTWFPLKDDPRQMVPFAIQPQAYAFPFDRIRIGDGPVHPYLSSDSAWLRSLDADKMMAPYVKQAGLPEVAPPYGALGASTTGHFLSALALAYANTGETAFKIKSDRMVSEFARVQKAIGTGDIGLGDGPTDFWDEVVQGGSHLRPGDMNLNGVNVPWYVYHKAFAGLLDAHLWTGNSQALEVAQGLGDWIIAKFGPMPESEFQRMLQSEFGGMEECLEDLYLLTGKTKYRDMGRRFTRKWSMGDLFAGKDNLNHKHGNTHLPQYMSAARRSITTTDASQWTAASTAWQSIVEGRTFSMGGTTNWESWQVDPGQFPLVSPNDHDSLQNRRRGGPETCISYNLLKMGMQMLARDRRTRVGDAMERTFWNHILAAWNPENHGTIYFTPVHHGLSKAFVTSESWWPCCRNSALESQMRHGAFAWMWDGSGLIVEQFVASSLDWKEKGIRIHLVSRFPEEDTLRFKVSAASPGRFSLRVRKPHWLKEGAIATLNGSSIPATVDAEGRFAFDRIWSEGDELKLVLPQSLHLESKPDEPGRVSIFHGPILLAAILGAGDVDPAFPGARARPETWIHPIAGTQDWWALSADGKPTTLRPFYRVREECYSIYPRQAEGASGDAGILEAELADTLLTRTYSAPTASGGAYVGGIDNGNSSVTFGFRRPSAATCTLVVRYANGTSTPSRHAVSTSAGWTGSVLYPPTPGWGRFDSTTVAVPLVSGDNQVRFGKSDGFAELDRLRVSGCGSGSHLPWTWEAEGASLQDVRLDFAPSNASAGAAVGGIDLATSRIRMLDVRAPRSGRWTCRILHSNGTASAARWTVRTARSETRVALAPTGGWNRYDTTVLHLDLDAQAQEVSVSRLDGYAQMDAFQVVSEDLSGLDRKIADHDLRWEGGDHLVADLALLGARAILRTADGRRIADAVFRQRGNHSAAHLETSGQGIAFLSIEGSGTPIPSIPVLRTQRGILPF